MANDILVKKTGTGLKDFLAALVKPLQTNTDLLDDFEAEQTKRATWNGQKIVLEAALNDIFGVTVAPFIYIEMNRDITTNVFFYQPSEAIPVYFSQPSENDPVYLSQPSELSAIDYDFTVFIPTGIHTAELERQLIAQTKLYKIVGPSFDVQTY